MFPIIWLNVFSFLETAPQLEDEEEEYMFMGHGDDTVEL